MIDRRQKPTAWEEAVNLPTLDRARREDIADKFGQVLLQSQNALEQITWNEAFV